MSYSIIGSGSGSGSVGAALAVNSPGGQLVQAPAKSWAPLIFQDLFKR